jgi:CheY-like chemotaxis protein
MTPCQPGHIMVVDDDATIRRLFSVIIESDLPEAKIEAAVNGADAVEAFEKAHHSIITMDLRMPVMDGFAAFRKIEVVCYEKGWEMPSVIFCTGFAPPDGVSEAISEDSQHALLHKPITPSQLTDEIRAHLS